MVKLSPSLLSQANNKSSDFFKLYPSDCLLANPPWTTFLPNCLVLSYWVHLHFQHTTSWFLLPSFFITYIFTSKILTITMFPNNILWAFIILSCLIFKITIWHMYYIWWTLRRRTHLMLYICPFPFQDLCQLKLSLKGQWKWETVEKLDQGYLEKPCFSLTQNGNCSILVWSWNESTFYITYRKHPQRQCKLRLVCLTTLSSAVIRNTKVMIWQTSALGPVHTPGP